MYVTLKNKKVYAHTASISPQQNCRTGLRGAKIVSKLQEMRNSEVNYTFGVALTRGWVSAQKRK